MAVLGAATPRRVWYRRPPSQFALLALPFVRTEFTYLLGRSPRLAPGKGRWNWARQANYDPVASSEIPAMNASRPAAVGRDPAASHRRRQATAASHRPVASSDEPGYPPRGPENRRQM